MERDNRMKTASHKNKRNLNSRPKNRSNFDDIFDKLVLDRFENHPKIESQNSF